LTKAIPAHSDAHNVNDLKQLWLRWHQGIKKKNLLITQKDGS